MIFVKDCKLIIQMWKSLNILNKMYFYFYRKHWFGKILGCYLELFCAVVNILTKTIYSNLLMSHKFI